MMNTFEQIIEIFEKIKKIFIQLFEALIKMFFEGQVDFGEV